jgi:hypothetical protein
MIRLSLLGICLVGILPLVLVLLLLVDIMVRGLVRLLRWLRRSIPILTLATVLRIILRIVPILGLRIRMRRISLVKMPWGHRSRRSPVAVCLLLKVCKIILHVFRYLRHYSAMIN